MSLWLPSYLELSTRDPGEQGASDVFAYVNSAPNASQRAVLRHATPVSFASFRELQGLLPLRPVSRATDFSRGSPSAHVCRSCVTGHPWRIQPVDNAKKTRRQLDIPKNTSETPYVLPQPEQPFKGVIGKTYKD